MLFKLDAKQVVKCKVSKFIKMPFIQLKDSKPPQCYIDGRKPLPLYTIVSSYHQTIFYTKNNAVYFYHSLLSSDSKIFPFYDYRREGYYLTRLEYVKTGYTYGIINCFKSYNGDLYIIYSVGQENDSKSEIVVYNCTKNTTIYRKETQWLDTMIFTIPIANSFLVSVSRSGYDMWIRIIDVITEQKYDKINMDLFIVSLKDYFVNIIKLIENKVSKEDIRRLNKIANDIAGGYLSYEDIQYLGIPEITITASIHDNDIVFYKGFQIQFEQIRLKRLNTAIHKAFSVSFMFEDDKIFIQVGTGEGGYIVINGNYIHIPPDVYWLIGEYKLSNEYNLSNSRLYSVSKVSKEYIIIDGAMYYPYPEIPQTYVGRMYRNIITHEFDGNGISILSVNSTPITVLGFTSLKFNYKASVYITKKLYNEINMINVSQLVNKIRQMQNDYSYKLLEIMKVPKDFIKTISIEDNVLSFLSKIYKRKHSNSSYSYSYYIDEEKGYMYCLVIYTNEVRNKHAILLRYYIEDDNISPKIMGYTEIKSHELEKNQKILDIKIASLIAYQKGNKLRLDRFLLLYRHNCIYNYMNDIILEMKYPLFIFSDIKHNRTGKFNYYNSKFKEVRDVRTDRSYNVVEWFISGKMGRSNVDVTVPIIVSELTVNTKLELTISKRASFILE